MFVGVTWKDDEVETLAPEEGAADEEDSIAFSLALPPMAVGAS